MKIHPLRDANASTRSDPRTRILMLVPHEPHEDPRIAWVTQLCAQVARTDILAAVWTRKYPAVEYDGVVSTERFSIGEQASFRSKGYGSIGARLQNLATTNRYIARQHQAFLAENQHLGGTSQVSSARSRNPFRRLATGIDHLIGGTSRFFAYYWGLQPLFNAMANRALVTALRPNVVICHDIFALYAGTLVKKKFGCPLIYDSHEFTPQSDLLSVPTEVRFWSAFERKLARQCDAVIGVTPQLASAMSRLYGLKRTLSVPNAEPWTLVKAPSHRRPVQYPIKFLLQGNACPGRGFEYTLDQWRAIPAEKAVLYIRCPESAYKDSLKSLYADLIAAGQVQFLPPVTSTELVEAATFADVGVIPYPVKIFNNTPNLNHLYCCPNKLSQYMQAGLAIFATNSHFVKDRIETYQCGETFNAADAGDFVRAIRRMIDFPEHLQRMKTNSYDMARKDFNWDVQARPYLELLREFVPSATEDRVADQSRRAA